MSRLAPGAVIGMLGGGQLGRLMAIEAAKLGFRVHTYCPETNAPAAQVSSKTVFGAYDDAEKLKAFAAECDVISYEFENVPAACVDILEQAGQNVRPGRLALEKSQDRLIEKTFLRACGIPTVEFAQVDSPEDLKSALNAFGGQGVLKRRRDGYDGKGQKVLRSEADLDGTEGLLDAPCILEAFCPFELEVSVVLARTSAGETRAFDPPHNEHEAGILRRCHLPAPISEETARNAVAATKALADALAYVGVLALEFFVLKDGHLIANEFAPRVHNSGHWTPEACMTGQFEQHVRAIADWPLGPADRLFDVEMHNLLGEEVLELPRTISGDARFVAYGKSEPRPGRKMGHVTYRKLRN